MVSLTVVAQDIIATVHLFPRRRGVSTRLCSPRVESVSVFQYSLKPLVYRLTRFFEALEHLLSLDRIVDRLFEALLCFRVSCGEHENLLVVGRLGHHRYSVYLEAFPLANSAGYFLPFISSFALAASTGSTPIFSDSSVR